MKLYKWSGAGNLFVIIDGRNPGQNDSAGNGGNECAMDSPEQSGFYRNPDVIRQLCRDFGTDGLMILGDGREPSEGNGREPSEGNGREPSEGNGREPSKACSRELPGATACRAGDRAALTDFSMEFYNPDGSSGMMCGNGGRCIAAFADYLGIVPASGTDTFVFDAPDGLHTAEIQSRPSFTESPGSGKEHSQAPCWTVRLGMKDTEGITEYPDGLFLNTGTRHFVKFVPDVDALDIEKEALPIRHDPRFAPEGTNVNFVEVRLRTGMPSADGTNRGISTGEGSSSPVEIRIRTFEKGVEGETAACGTGITAAALACCYKGIAPNGGTVATPDGSTAASPNVSSVATPDGSTAASPNVSSAATPKGTAVTPKGTVATPDGSTAASPNVSSAATPKGTAATPDGGASRSGYSIQAREATLEVDFLRNGKDSFSEIFLTGPAALL